MPYWIVFLNQEQAINRFVIYNRNDSESERLLNFSLTAYDNSSNEVFKYEDRHSEAQAVYTITPLEQISPVAKVEIRTTHRQATDIVPVLTLCEVEIYGDSVCPPGTYGRTCERKCNCLNESCFTSTGGCPSGCAAGFYGESCHDACPLKTYGSGCTLNCSTNCVEHLCDRVTGECDTCPPGRIGMQCDQPCPPQTYGQGCTDNCSSNCEGQLCDSESGTCEQCPSGKTGENCDSDCPSGTYGPRCISSCSTNCEEQLCDSVTGRCDQCPSGKTGEQCDQICSSKTYGPRCITDCSINCEGQVCDRVTGRCQQCPSGKTGEQCDETCPPKTYGGRCTSDCSTNCEGKLCDRETGRCYQCPSGKTGDMCGNDCSSGTYGPRCVSKCSTTCEGQLCDKVTGRCYQCLSGMTGDKCDKTCPSKTYGPRCTSDCSTNCVEQLCDRVSGRCHQCPSGKTGEKCDQVCPSKTYGQRCTSKCSTNCVGQLCDRITGRCYQCPSGKTRDKCDQDCSSEYCKNGGKCVGRDLCDCTVTGHYGDKCQYSEQEIPVKHYTFTGIDKNTIHTTSGNLAATGSVTLNKNGDKVEIVIPAGSYVTTNGPTATCLHDIDKCISGFTVEISYSFSQIDKASTQVVLTTGAGLEERVKGVSLYYKSDQVYCYVVTSTRQWSVVKPFSLDTSTTYETIVSWHRENGVLLRHGNSVTGSSDTFKSLNQDATNWKPLMIGSPKFSTSTTVLRVSDFAEYLLLWEDLERSRDSSDDELNTEAIVIGIVVPVVCAIIGVVGGCLYCNREKPRKDIGHTSGSTEA